MIRFSSGVFKAGPDVFGLKVGIVLQDFTLRCTSSEQVEHILDTDTHAPDARPTAALVWIKSDSVHDFSTIGYGCGLVKGT